MSKANPEEMEFRVATVTRWMMKGDFFKHRLIARIKKKWGVEHRQAFMYICQARERLLVHLNQTKKELRAESMAFYLGVLVDPKAMIGEKIRARERIDKLTGIESPVQIKAEVAPSQRGIPLDRVPLQQRKLLLDAIRSGEVKDVEVIVHPEED